MCCVTGVWFSLAMKAMEWNLSRIPKPMNISSFCWRTISQSHLYVDWPMTFLRARTTRISLPCLCFYGSARCLVDNKQYFHILTVCPHTLIWLFFQSAEETNVTSNQICGVSNSCWPPEGEYCPFYVVFFDDCVFDWFWQAFVFIISLCLRIRIIT